MFFFKYFYGTHHQLSCFAFKFFFKNRKAKLPLLFIREQQPVIPLLLPPSLSFSLLQSVTSKRFTVTGGAARSHRMTIGLVVNQFETREQKGRGGGENKKTRSLFLHARSNNHTQESFFFSFLL